ncbi:phenylalanine--tRNA ligase subunit beta [Flavimarina sp. Hel_I_48]|uniref:phenylalanine--tRNA ligase subunit beta n=1 Tax=Flavimarina sp. Hel_I_48 TaxID=1392488 RepID=UPI0004DEE43E|nr:phenylalanine--tRNA ligase subunit beta [Flavimarina sp. Hel_I_48]
MQISYNWLKQFIKTDWDAAKTGELLTDLGLEVEGIEAFESIKGSLEGVVVGEVLTCVKHPNADRLQLTTVYLGNGDPVQIVCGAHNVAAGQKVPVATIGTTLYDDKGEAWTIKNGKIRGEESNGMICAEDELGLGKSHDGIMVLDKNLEPGTPLSELYDVESDHVFEIGLTPNRADAMSHMGVARDLRAGMVQLNLNSEFITPSTSSFYVANRTQKVTVEVADHELAPRYCGVTLGNLNVKESPVWLQNRLKSIGLTPKNNIVDATNYVLHELGQPLHAFDLSRVNGEEIQVKTLPSGTKFTTLDGVERELHEEDLMICDTDKPLCIAGVFGGEDSGVSEGTTSIFLESAYFNPVSIRKTAKRHGLNTDASFRFERGIDINITKYALKRAALLIQEIAGGEVTSDIVEIYPKKAEDHQVVLNYDRAYKLIGEEIPKETIKSILASLDIKIINVTESGLGMMVPPYRNDVTREVDVIEEILRVYGYNNIGFKTKLNASIASSNRLEDYRVQNIIGDQLAGLGFYEIMGNSLTSPAYVELTESLKKEHNVSMLNPLSNDLSVMRQSMLFSGLEAVSHNLNRRQDNFKFFEFGKTYHNYNGTHEEQKCLSLLFTGNRAAENWTVPAMPTTFFYLKGLVYAIIERLGLEHTTEKPVKNDIFSEGLQLSISKKEIVQLGTVTKKIAARFDIDQEVGYVIFNWDNILSLLADKKTLFTPIPKFPAVRRDFALLLDKNVPFSKIYDIANNADHKFLKDVNLFDVYEGKSLPEGKKSYAVSFMFQDEKKTMTDKQVDKIMATFRKKFEDETGATLR